MEKEIKQSKFGKRLLWTVLSYVAISVIAVVCSVIRSSVQGESDGVTLWMGVELILFPVLFLLAGYFVTVKGDLGRFKSYMVWLFATVFSGVLLVLWYFVLEAYVLLNLPAAEGVTAIDMFLRKITVIKDYTVLYLSETEGYRYVTLPLIHFALRIVYWLLFFLGNRIGVSKEK